MRGNKQGNNKTDTASSSSSSCCRWKEISFDRETSLLRRRNGFQELGGKKKLIRKKIVKKFGRLSCGVKRRSECPAVEISQLTRQEVLLDFSFLCHRESIVVRAEISRSSIFLLYACFVAWFWKPMCLHVLSLLQTLSIATFSYLYCQHCITLRSAKHSLITSFSSSCMCRC